MRGASEERQGRGKEERSGEVEGREKRWGREMGTGDGGGRWGQERRGKEGQGEMGGREMGGVGVVARVGGLQFGVACQAGRAAGTATGLWRLGLGCGDWAVAIGL